MEFRTSFLQASVDLLQTNLRDERRGSVLLIKHPELPWPESESISRNQQSFGQAVHLNLGIGPERLSGMVCSTGELPFLEHSFHQVVLWHALGDIRQAELTEACRVLTPGGEMLVLGLNAWGWAARSEPWAGALPRLPLHGLVRHLPELGLKVKAVCGSGLLGWSRVRMRRSSFTAALMPLADLQMVVAEHSQPATLSPIPFKRLPAGVAPTA